MLRQGESGWSNPRVLSLFVVIFLCGLTIGSTVASFYLHAKFKPTGSIEPIKAAERYGLLRLQHQLNLTPDQVKIVTKELDDYAKYYENIEEERTDVAEHGRQRILKVLNEDQKKRFNQIFGPVSR